MTGCAPLIPSHQDRLAGPAPGTAPGERIAWAALASLLFHSTALAAALIAVSGQGPRLPEVAIEVAVVVAASAPQGAAAARSEQAANAVPPAEPAPQREAEPDEARSAPAEPVRDEAAVKPAVLPERDVLARVTAVATPLPPRRKPAAPDQSWNAKGEGERSAAASSAAPADLAMPPSAQLAALPDGDSSDSVAAPGAGPSEPPRYLPGGEDNPWPSYPSAARRRGIEGEALIRVAVGADGVAGRVEILRSSGSALLDAAAVEALSRWRFEPAHAAGVPVAASIDIPVTFRLTDASD